MNPETSTLERPKPKFTRGDAKKPERLKVEPHRNQHSRNLGPHSKVHRLVRVDGRTSAGLIVKRLRDDLIKHIGGNPSVVQRVMIERCCFLQLRISLLDIKITSGHTWTENDNNSYLSWTANLVRIMSRLGVEPKRSTPRPSLNAILESSA
jgi:hypothetical protein